MPEPLKEDSEPPEVVTSPTTKLVDASDKVNVTVSEDPWFSTPVPVRAIVTVGRV